MGKGDKKSRKGKIAMGSYGVSRPKRKKVTVVKTAKKTKPAAEKVEVEAKKAAPKKAAAKKAAPKKTGKKED